MKAILLFFLQLLNTVQSQFDEFAVAARFEVPKSEQSHAENRQISLGKVPSGLTLGIPLVVSCSDDINDISITAFTNPTQDGKGIWSKENQYNLPLIRGDNTLVAAIDGSRISTSRRPKSGMGFLFSNNRGVYFDIVWVVDREVTAKTSQVNFELENGNLVGRIEFSVSHQGSMFEIESADLISIFGKRPEVKFVVSEVMSINNRKSFRIDFSVDGMDMPKEPSDHPKNLFLRLKLKNEQQTLILVGNNPQFTKKDMPKNGFSHIISLR